VRKLFYLILIVAAVIVLARNFNEQPVEPTTDGSPTVFTTTTSANDVAYALSLRKAAWPPLDVGDTPASAQTSAVATLNYYVVLDGSGSMRSERCGGGKPKIDAAIVAMKAFFANAPSNANIGLAAFDQRAVEERVPLGVGNRAALNDALDKIIAGADTPLRSAIKIGYDKLTAQARTQLSYGEYHLVVVTDGQPDPPDENPTSIVNEILSRSPVVLHTVGFCIDEHHALNQPNRTYYASATNPLELQQSLQAVLAEAPVFDAAKF
jgi:Ca-activated chloride channel homolog